MWCSAASTSPVLTTRHSADWRGVMALTARANAASNAMSGAALKSDLDSPGRVLGLVVEVTPTGDRRTAIVDG